MENRWIMDVALDFVRKYNTAWTKLKKKKKATHAVRETLTSVESEFWIELSG